MSKGTRSSTLLGAIASAGLLSACAGPPALQDAVIGYDKTTASLDQQLLLINIARSGQGLPLHFTQTRSIAATFDWSATVGASGDFPDSAANSYGLNLGASARENPTFSIVPVTGTEFTQQILTPLSEDVLNLNVFQGQRIDQALRLMADSIEIQDEDGIFVREIFNDPARPSQYREFRQIVSHLRWLQESQQLFVRRLVFEDVLLEDFSGPMTARDGPNAFTAGYDWIEKENGNYMLTAKSAGRVVILNYDPMTLTDKERSDLNDTLDLQPANFVYISLRGDMPGGDIPVEGFVTLRSISQILSFISNGIDSVPEFHVEPDPRTGEVDAGPASTVRINVLDERPGKNLPVAEYEGSYYAVGESTWDLQSFVILSYLFQNAIGDVKDPGLPITIAK